MVHKRLPQFLHKELVTFDSIVGSQNVEMYQCVETAERVVGANRETARADEGVSLMQDQSDELHDSKA